MQINVENFEEYEHLCNVWALEDFIYWADFSDLMLTCSLNM